jgi:hypothetical protein
VRLSRDYRSAYFHDKTWTPRQTVVGEPLQERLPPKVQEMQAVRVRITAMPITADVGDGPFDTYSEAFKLTSLGVELGLERGLKRLPAAQ